MEIVVATTNDHKLQELRKIMPESFKITGIRDLGFMEDIPETGDTFAANALQKAHYIYQRIKKTCLADDSGLEVNALDGKPGVFSARYAGPEADSVNNLRKLLFEMKGLTNRTARFKTVLALIHNNQEFLFEGVINGRIAETPSGEKGFGYDPVFIPQGYNRTFSEMSADEKNSISHRAEAVRKLLYFLEKPGSYT